MFISDLSHLEVVTEDKNIQGGNFSNIQIQLFPNAQTFADALASAAGPNFAYTNTTTNTVTVSVGGLYAASSESQSVALSA